jgi:hypothetical protein
MAKKPRKVTAHKKRKAAGKTFMDKYTVKDSKLFTDMWK